MHDEAQRLILTHRARADVFAYVAEHFNFTMPQFLTICEHWSSSSKRTADVIERLIDEISKRQQQIETAVDESLDREAMAVIGFHQGDVEISDYMYNDICFSESSHEWFEATDNHIKLHMNSAKFTQRLLDEVAALREQSE